MHGVDLARQPAGSRLGRSGSLPRNGFNCAKSASGERMKSPILLVAKPLFPDFFERIFQTPAFGRAQPL